MPGFSESYQDVFAGQGIPTDFRGPEHYFFHTVTEDESSARAGEVYAIPTQLNLDREIYNHQENGALISQSATLDPEVIVHGRSIIHPQAVLERETEVGWSSTIGFNSRLSNVITGNGVEIGAKAVIDNASINHESKLGQVSIYGVKRPSIIGMLVTMEDHVRLDGGNVVRDHSTLHWGASLHEGATVGASVEIDEKAEVLKYARVGDGSRVLEGVEVKAGKLIPPETVVYPNHFKRSKRGW